MDRYQPRAYKDTWFVLDHRFQRYYHAGMYERAISLAKGLNEVPEIIPMDPSLKSKEWLEHPRQAV